jgi:tRNA-binding EMAP/Myf-like protein
MAYQAIICKLKNVRKHPNADRLLLAEAYGYQVIVGLNQQENDLGIMFPCDGQLSEEFAAANDLVTRIGEDGKRAGGYFGKNRRVRAQNFRGEKSEGFWCPVEYLDKMIGEEVIVKEGQTFTEINGIPVCNKYITPATKAAQGQRQHKRRENRYFAKHVDTKQLRYEIGNIPDGSFLTITEKLHGTSARVGYVLDEVKPSFWKKILMWIGAIPKRTDEAPLMEYKYLTGSRNVILNDVGMVDHYYGDNFRQIISAALQPHINKGEIWYGEIVGPGIMGSVGFDKIQDKELRKELKDWFGNEATYNYGHDTPHFYLYRITITNEDGDVYELPWSVVKKRAKESNVECVPELLIQEYYDKDVRFAFETVLKQIVEYNISSVVPNQLREGVVVRVDTPEGNTYWLKEKNFVFKVLEGIAKEDADYIDTEESS